jgi:hypothetical protein
LSDQIGDFLEADDTVFVGAPRWEIGDILEADDTVFVVEGIEPGRIEPRLRYRLNSGKRIVFRYVAEFDERDDVELLSEPDETETDEDDDDVKTSPLL